MGESVSNAATIEVYKDGTLMQTMSLKFYTPTAKDTESNTTDTSSSGSAASQSSPVSASKTNTGSRLPIATLLAFAVSAVTIGLLKKRKHAQ